MGRFLRRSFARVATANGELPKRKLGLAFVVAMATLVVAGSLPTVSGAVTTSTTTTTSPPETTTTTTPSTTTTTTPSGDGSQGVPTMLTPSATAGGGNPASNYVPPSSGDPVNDQNGDFYETFTDASIPGRGPALDLTRTYNLNDYPTNSPFGYGWSSSYTMSLTIAGSTETITQENGSTVAFSSYVAPTGAYATLTYNSSNSTYTYVRKTTQTFVFNSSGQLISESDPNGYTTTLTYTSGKLTTVTDPAGRTLTFTYGSNGLIASLTDPLGRVTSYGYDGTDDLTSITDPMGRVTSFTYSTHELLTTTDPNGGTTTNVDSGSQIASQTDPMGLVTTWSYGSGTTTITDPHGSVTLDDFTGGLLTSSTVAHGTSSAATTSYVYDGNDNLYSTTDPNSHTTYTEAGENGLVNTSIDGVGNVTSYAYNALDETTNVTPPTGTSTTSAFDSGGNLLSKAVYEPGSAWTSSSSPSSDPYLVSCVSTAFCMETDQGAGGYWYVRTTSNPTSSSPTWSSSFAPGTGISTLSCPTTNFCLGGDDNGDMVYTTNPTATGGPTWGDYVAPDIDVPEGISCPSASFCMMYSISGLWTTTNPTSSSAWSLISGPAGYGMPYFSCPSTSFCIGEALDGKTYSTTNPTASSPTWTLSNGPNVLAILSCPTTSFCMAGDHTQTWVTTNPTASSPTWYQSAVLPSASASELSCASATFCMVLGPTNIDTSTAPALTAATTTYSYGDTHAGDVTQVSDPAGHVTNYAYDTYGDVVTTTTNPSAGVTDVTKDVYDTDGEKICEASPSAVANGINCPSAGSSRVAGTTTWTYNPDGQVLTETDSLGHVTTSVYDGDGNTADTIDPLGNITKTSYDLDSRVTNTSSGYLSALSPAPVQQSSAASISGSTETVTLPANVTPGDGLTLSFENVLDGVTVASVTGGGSGSTSSNSGTSWAKANQENNSSSSADNEIWYLQDSAGGSGSSTVTIALSGSASQTYPVNVTEWRGALVPDKAPAGTTGTGTTLSAPSVTPTYPNEVVLEEGGAKNANTGAEGGGFTALTLHGYSPFGSYNAVAGYVSTTSISAQQLTQTWQASTAWSGTSESFVLVPAFGSSTPVQQSSGTSTSASTETVTLPSNVTAGDGLTLSFENPTDTTTVTSVSGGGGTWTKANQENNSSTSADNEIWYLQASTGGSGTTSITLTLSGTAADTYPVDVVEWRGALALDQTPAGTTGSGTTMSAPSLTPSYQNEVVLEEGGARNANTGAEGGNFSSLTLHGYAPFGSYNSVVGYVSTAASSAQQLTQAWQASTAWSGTSASFTVGNNTQNGYDLVPGTSGWCSSSVSGALYCTVTVSGNNEITLNYFNANNDEIEIVIPGGLTSSFTYDRANNQLTKTTAAGTTSDAYDADNRVSSVAYSGTASGYTAPHGVTYSYDADGRRTQMVDGTGTTTYTYDWLGRLTSTTNGASSALSYGYDLDNEVTSITYPGSQSIAYTYDGAGEMTKVTDFQNRATTFTYSTTSTSSGPKLITSYASGTSVTATANGDDDEVALAASSPTLGISYTRNADEDITGETTSVSGTTWYTVGDGYSADTQVTSSSATGLSNDTGAFGYDPAGNPTTTVSPTSGSAVTQSFNGSQELTGTTSGATSVTYGYDSIGDRTSKAVSGGSSVAYTYSQVGQLLSETPSGGSAVTYAYNGDGVRMSKTVSGTAENYTYDTLGSVPLLLQDGSTDLIYGPGGSVVEQEVSTTPLFYVDDALGSTQWLLNLSGSVVGSFAYGTYGSVLSHTGTSSTPIGYAGYYTDSETGFLYLVNRYYDSTTGEFITVDPLYGGTSNPTATGPGAGSSPPQPVSLYQWALGAAPGIQFISGDPEAGLDGSNSGNTSGLADYSQAFGLPDIALAALSSINGLAITSPVAPNPSYVGAGFSSPNSVSSSESPYAYAGGDPVNGVDPGGMSWWNPYSWGVATYHYIRGHVGGVLGTILGILAGAAVAFTLTFFIAGFIDAIAVGGLEAVFLALAALGPIALVIIAGSAVLSCVVLKKC
jgi:RHS repeat-associated protein